MSSVRKLTRLKAKQKRDAFRHQLVKEGKKIVFDGKQFKIVEAQKPFRKEKKEEENHESKEV